MTNTRLQRTNATPTRYTPLGSTLAREVNEMRDRMRRFFQQPFDRELPDVFGTELTQAVGWIPAVELSENENEFLVTAELPGMQPTDVQVTFDDGVLTIRGEREEKKEERDRRYHLWERGYGTFLRTFTFPVAIDDEKIVAEHKDGLLEVRVPKLPGSKPQGRKIEVVSKA